MNDLLGEMLGCIILFGIVCLLLVFLGPILPPNFSMFDEAEIAKARTDLQVEAYLLDIDRDMRIQFRGFGNIRIYLNGHKYQEIPYPDRDSIMAPLVASYSKNLNFLAYVIFPSIRIYDIRSGKKLDSFSCAYSKLHAMQKNSPSK